MKLLKNISFVLLLLSVISINNKANAQKYNIPTTTKFIEAVGAKISGDDNAISLFENYLKETPDDDAAWYHLSELYASDNQIEEAINAAKKSIEIDDDNIYYLKNLARLIRSIPPSDELLDLYEKITTEDPHDIQSQIDYANALLTTNYYDRTLNQLFILKDILGVNEDINAKIANIYEKQNKPKKAYAEIIELIDTYPTETRYVSMLAEMYMRNGDEKKALECYNIIAEKNPEDPYIHITKAEYYRKKNQEDKVHNELTIGLSSDQLDVNTKITFLLAFYNTEEILLKKNKYAIDLLKLISNMHPDDPKSLSMLADYYINDNQIGAARQGYYKVLDLGYENPNIYLALITIEAYLNNVDSVLSLSNKGIENYPVIPEFYFYKGIGLSMQQKFEEAIDVFNMGLPLVVKNDYLKSRFNIYLGDAYHTVGDYKKAYESYDKSLEIDPNNPYVLNNYSYYLSTNKDYSNNTTMLNKAAEMASKAVELEPNSPHYLDTYGWALFKLKDYDKALEYLEKALKISDNNSKGVILEHLGDVYWMKNNTKKALKYWNESLKTDPDNASDTLNKKIKDQKYYEL